MTREDFESKDAAFDWLEKKVDDPCMDNYRFAFEDDDKQMQAYEQSKLDGCCGFWDEKISINGRAARIGCNYGH